MLLIFSRNLHWPMPVFLHMLSLGHQHRSYRSLWKNFYDTNALTFLTWDCGLGIQNDRYFLDSGRLYNIRYDITKLNRKQIKPGANFYGYA